MPRKPDNTTDDTLSAPTETKDGRRERLSDALRANLAKRKSQARDRAGDDGREHDPIEE